mmetsp:Transcript_54633/g.157090  ORF Transcript_54633/g.157090 Transcript_54633/m.157090 type:complete len:373 (-) Transcript_54633:51-1169(-)
MHGFVALPLLLLLILSTCTPKNCNCRWCCNHLVILFLLISLIHVGPLLSAFARHNCNCRWCISHLVILFLLISLIHFGPLLPTRLAAPYGLASRPLGSRLLFLRIIIIFLVHLGSLSQRHCRNVWLQCGQLLLGSQADCRIGRPRTPQILLRRRGPSPLGARGTRATPAALLLDGGRFTSAKQGRHAAPRRSGSSRHILVLRALGGWGATAAVRAAQHLDATGHIAGDAQGTGTLLGHVLLLLLLSPRLQTRRPLMRWPAAIQRASRLGSREPRAARENVASHPVDIARTSRQQKAWPGAAATEHAIVLGVKDLKAVRIVLRGTESLDRTVRRRRLAHGEVVLNTLRGIGRVRQASSHAAAAPTAVQGKTHR